MMKEVPATPNTSMPSADVRDIAKAHYQAFITPNLHGERFLISKENLSFRKVTHFLDKEFSQYGY